MEAEAKPRVYAGRSPAQEAGTSSGAEPGPSEAANAAERRHPRGEAAEGARQLGRILRYPRGETAAPNEPGNRIRHSLSSAP